MRNVYIVVPILFLLAGCNNHPLVGDVTDNMTTAEIFEKIRCEARTAIWNQLNIKKVAGLHSGLLKSKKELKEYNEWRTENTTLLTAFGKKYSTQQERMKDNETKLDNLKELAEQLKSETDQLSRLLGKTPSTVLDERLDGIVVRRQVLQSKISALNERQAMLKEGRKDIENAYRGYFNKIGTTPERYLKMQKQMEDRAKALKSEDPDPSGIKDELSDQDWKSFRDLITISRTTLSMQLDFKITENNNANADGSLKWPIHLGSVSLSYKPPYQPPQPHQPALRW